MTVYVSFFRGTPLFVQILLMQFAILPFFIHPTEGLLISGDLAREIRSTYGAMLAGIVAITLNAGAYLSEVFRAGIQSLDKGQMEAARSVGMTELAYAARTVAGATARYWEPYITISLMYWVMTLGLAYLVKKMEQRLGKGDDNR